VRDDPSQYTKKLAMLFNSPEFLFVFLPLVLGVYHLLNRREGRSALYWLVAASLFFYGWWNPAFLLLIGASITINFLFGAAIRDTAGRQRKLLLITGIAANLACIGYFKYTGFILGNLNALMNLNLNAGSIVLPLAISFFTFQQIAFLVDAYRNAVKENDFARYGLFVVFFPQLIAGPIVHHREMMPQFGHQLAGSAIARNINIGITVFAIGLFKKVVLADTLALVADPAFAMAQAQQGLSFLDAWSGALAYTFQLYFDFSGYSDMAVGIAIMFGIRLPLNFYSPYKARSIIDFWRRWHMTLSRFLKDYVYIPLGGNRKGRYRRHINLMITMLLGGIWHGAGWPFVVWGALHGIFLVINHAWRNLMGRTTNEALRQLNRLIALPLTFVCVVVAWVFFRAPTMEAAQFMLAAMLPRPDTVAAGLSWSKSLVSALQDHPLTLLIEPLSHNPAHTTAAVVLVFSALVALLMPNTVNLLGTSHPALSATVPEQQNNRLRSLQWQPSLPWAVCVAVLLFACALFSTGLSPFLYFQF
jgi:D-alanyl-lipoteichoic acid acyltransferase DltB (MBOAT superfamily)